MANCQVCGNDYLRCNCESQQPYCEQCGNDGCLQEMDSACVVYHPLPTTQPSKLENLNMPNGSSAEKIFEAIDNFLGNNANVPITPVDSDSIDLTTSGVANHTIKADLKVSPDTLNQLEVRDNGVYAKPYNENYWVKTDAQDNPDYLEEKIVGGSDGIVSVSVVNQSGVLVILPTINVQALLDKIRIEFGDQICELISNCISYSWVLDEFTCQSEDLDIITQKTITNLPEPIAIFEDGGRLYFVSQSNNIGKVWSVDPDTFTNVSDIVYLNETRNGQPYGPSGGTYVSGAPYRGNSSGSGNGMIGGYYFDKPTRTLYLHGNRTNGMDYYSFVTGTWDKIGTGSTGSSYNTTISADYFTHTRLGSNDDTNFIIAGWGTNSGDRGRMVIIVDKNAKVLTTELDATGSPTFPGITGNPFNLSWGGFFTADGRIFIAKANVSDYRNIAVFNSNLTPILEIVPVNSNTGFNSTPYYWQNSFIDITNNKFYFNDYMSRKIEVYDTNTYALLKIFSFDNNRTYSTAEVSMSINSITQELFFDIGYGGISATSGDNAPISEMVSYKVDRTTLDVIKTYIGSPRAVGLLPLTNGDIVTALPIDLDPNSPTSSGIATFYEPNPAALTNGTVEVETLKEINDNTGVATGNTKPNIPSDPDYIAPFLDTTLCPINYTLAAPSSIILTATDAPRYSIDFGLNDDVVKNPVLASIVATIRNTTTSTTLGTKVWTIPNNPNPNAFFDVQNLAGIAVGNNITVDLVYRNASSTPIATYNNIVTVTAVAN